MHVYFDNCIVSGEIRGDLAPPAELAAVAALRQLASAGRIVILTSLESVREQERTRDAQMRQVLLEGTAGYPKVARNHDMLGAQLCPDATGSYISNRAFTDIVDHQLFTALGGVGLKTADAKHLMYAEANACDWFVTTDPHFLEIRAALERLCARAKIRTPAQLLGELS